MSTHSTARRDIVWDKEHLQPIESKITIKAEQSTLSLADLKGT